MPFSDQLIEGALVRAVQNVCHTMIKEDVRLVGRTPTPPVGEAFAEFRVLGSVGFVGATNGILYLCLTDDFAIWATGTMLGMSRGEVEMNGPDVVKDAMGELTNMAAGGFKNELADTGYPCKLTLPTIVRGKHVAVAAIKSASRFVFEFDCAGHRLLVDVQIQAET